MYVTKKGSISLVGIFGIGMLTLLLCLLGNAPVQAASEDAVTEQETISSADPQQPPKVYYTFYLTDPYWYDLNWHLIDGGLVEAEAQSDETGRVSGQASLQLATPYRLEFAQVETILRDANQTPIGVRINGRGATANGRAFSFIYTTQRSSDGRCCVVEIWAPELHASGGVRFEAAGELRFE